MRGFTGFLETLFNALGLDLPPWGMPVFALAIGALLLPFVLRNERTRRARKAIKELGQYSGAERQTRIDLALDATADHAPGLVAIAEEALRRGWNPLAERAVGRLEQLGTDPRQAARLRKDLAPPERAMVLEAEVAAIERFIDAGVWVKATERLADARRMWPEDRRWPALEQRLAAGRAAPSTASGAEA